MTNRNGGMGEGQGAQQGANLDQIKDSVRGLVDRGQEQVGHLKDRAVEVKDEVLSRGNAYLDQATTYIRANPLKAVGIAFGVGFIGMRLFRR